MNHSRMLTITSALLGLLLWTLPLGGQVIEEKVQPLAGTEDDGAIPLANVVALIHGPVRLASTIGDGPHGSFGTGSGDYDWWEIEVNSGWIISVDLDAADAIGSTLDPVVGIYNAVGDLLASDDDFADSTDSFLEHTASATGSYYVVVRGFGTGFQSDPFNSGSGLGFGSEGDYILTISLSAVHP